MGQIIDLSAEQVVLRCRCGCLTFYHHASGAAECAACHLFARQATTEWRKQLPDPIAPVPQETSEDVHVINLASPQYALKRTLSLANLEETAVVVIMQKDGALRVWGQDIDTPEKELWFKRKCNAALEMLRMGARN